MAAPPQRWLGDYGRFLCEVLVAPYKDAFFLLALGGYLLSVFFYVPVLLRRDLVLSAMIWILLNTTGFVLLGLLVFKETLTTLQLLGLVAGVVALILLSV